MHATQSHNTARYNTRGVTNRQKQSCNTARNNTRVTNRQRITPKHQEKYRQTNTYVTQPERKSKRASEGEESETGLIRM